MKDSRLDKKTEGESGLSDLEAVFETARERWRLAYDADKENIQAGWEDLKFYCGDQWDSRDVSARQQEQRPCLTLNQLPRFVRQVTGDMRQAKPAIKVNPIDDSSDPEVAQICENIVRMIENTPDARAAYFWGVDSQVTAGVGHWRVLADYASDDTFDQDLKIIPIRNGLGVLWDPAAELPTREDAMWCFVTEDMPLVDFKAKYPEAQASDVDSTDVTGDEWFGIDQVRVAEYWVKKPYKRRLAKLQDGRVVEITKDNAFQYAGQIVKEAEREAYKVCRYLMSGAEILEGPVIWPGRFIPIIRVAGEETQLEKRTVRKSLIRNAKDAQRLYNYWRTAQTEFVALQPKAPFIGTHRNFAENLADWEAANKTPLPYLGYEPDPANGGAAPQRALPPANSSGFDAGVAFAVEDLKATTGLYDASLGERSNETSGKAILARQREGDVATYVFFDNFSRAVAQTGRVLIDLIPHFYDTERLVRVLGPDGTEKAVKVNFIDPVTGQVNYDLTVGKYDVMVDTGPSYTTRREEAREGMTALMQAAGPEGLVLFGDLYARVQDWPYADEFAERLKMLRERQEQAQAGPDPQQAAAMAEQQFAMQMQAKQAEQQLALQAKEQEAVIDLEKKRAEIAIQLEAKQVEAGMRVMQEGQRVEREQSSEDVTQAIMMLAGQVQQLTEIIMASQPPQPMPEM